MDPSPPPVLVDSPSEGMAPDAPLRPAAEADTHMDNIQVHMEDWR